MRKYFTIVMLMCSLCFAVAQQPVHQDTHFLQDQSELFEVQSEYSIHLDRVAADRNGQIQISSNAGTLKPYGGRLMADHQYAFMDDCRIVSMISHRDQFVYLTDDQIFSNAWAGRLLINHTLRDAKMLAGGSSFDFLIGSDSGLEYYRDGSLQWKKSFGSNHRLSEVTYVEATDQFFIVDNHGLHQFTPSTVSYQTALAGEGFTCVRVLDQSSEWYIGTDHGLLRYQMETGKEDLDQKIPWDEITTMEVIDDKLWVGTKRGAFTPDQRNGYNYYASRRWMIDDHVLDIAPGAKREVLLLTTRGLSIINFSPMTLHDKALHFEKQVRDRHIRHGFNSAEFVMRIPGDLNSGSVVDSDNDGLWTSMYLGSQLFRYKVTGSPEAYQNAIEAFEAMERLNDINPIKGFLSRSYERRSYAKHDLDAWRKAKDPEWDWKGTTSSDESIGHYFAFCLMAEIIPDTAIKRRAIDLIRDMTDHILENDLYLVDIDGKPTRWGRWNPDYVNGFPKGVGDRKLNSSNITGFLQAAYHFTGDEKYKKAAFTLFEDHGYLENLMMPMEEVGVRKSGPLATMLSSSWNHSDDEMYFLSYWYLHPYAFDQSLKEKYLETIKNHWNIERPERDALWNFCYGMTGAKEFDLAESIWYLQEFPLDLINYSISNSHRKDIELVPKNFRNQTTAVVLPPDEKPMYKHNTNTFVIDRDSRARSESSGDIYLLPYWMGRYLGVISEPHDRP